VSHFQTGLAAYRAADWNGAIRAFERALHCHSADAPSEMYVRRCRHYLANPPPAGWDGAWVLTEK
jgi:adenylate cyclase